MAERDEQGAVTAETAVVIPVLVVLAAALACLVALGVSQVRTVDAAREAARAIARGEDRPTAIGLARRVAPAGAEVSIVVEGHVVRVTVTAEVRGPGGVFGLVPGLDSRAEAVAALESLP